MEKDQSNDQIDDRIEAVIRHRSLQGIMSNAKWVKLINCLVLNSDIVNRMEFKSLLGYDGVITISPDKSYNFDYWDAGFEGMASQQRWVAYKEIEFVRFPHTFIEKGKHSETQDVYEIQRVVSETGMFDLFFEKEDVILQCYK